TAAQELKAEGKSGRAIGRGLGVDHETVRKDLGEKSPVKKTASKHHEDASADNSPLDRITALAATTEIREAAARQEIRQEREAMHATARANQPIDLTGRYRVVYADPSWQYSDSGVITSSDAYGRAERHYPTMSVKEIAALPVCDHIADNAVLFLWITSPLLMECSPVIDGWGFTYKTSFVWDKVDHNYGHYNSVRHEVLLVATRGSCLPDRPTPMPDSVQTIRRSREHSAKPEEFRALIMRLYD